MALTAAQITKLESARDNYVTKLLEVSANPKPSYTVGNQTFDHPAYMKVLREEIAGLDELISTQGADVTFDVVSQGYAP